MSLQGVANTEPLRRAYPRLRRFGLGLAELDGADGVFLTLLGVGRFSAGRTTQSQNGNRSDGIIPVARFAVVAAMRTVDRRGNLFDAKDRVLKRRIFNHAIVIELELFAPARHLEFGTRDRA